MGLDLFHFKMIPHPGAALKKHTHTILLRNIPSGLATEYGLDSRCYGIPVMEIQHTVRIYQDIPALETAERSGQLRPHEKEGVSWLVGSVESCGEELQRIEQALGLVPAGVHRMKMNDYSESVPAEIGTSVWWSPTVTYMGSYLELAGYQRKGVLEESIIPNIPGS